MGDSYIATTGIEILVGILQDYTVDEKTIQDVVPQSSKYAGFETFNIGGKSSCLFSGVGFLFEVVRNFLQSSVNFVISFN